MTALLLVNMWEAGTSKTLADNLPDPIIRYDTAGRRRYLNPAAQRMLGASSGQLLEQTPENDSPASRAMVAFFRRKMEEAMETGTVVEAEFLLDRLLIEERENYLARFVPEFDADGNIDGVLVIGRNITERKMTERALREKDEKLRNLYEFSPLGIGLTDMQGHFVEVNKAFCDLCGYSPAELEQMDCLALTLPKFWDISIREMARASSTGHYGPYEKVYRRKDGATVPVRVHGMVMTDRNGNRNIWAFVEDITEQKATEAALSKREQEFRALVENAPDTIMRYDLDCRQIYVNPHFLKMVGKPAAEVLGCRPTDYSSTPEAQAYERILSYALKTGMAWDHEYTWPAAGGRMITSHFRIVPERGPDGAVTSVLAIGYDITERKQIEQSLRENEAFLNSLLDAMPLPVFYKDRMGRYLGFNKAYESFFGASKELLTGKTVFEISPKEQAEIFHAKDEELFARQGEQRYESKVQNAQGSQREVVFNKAVFADSQGRVAGLIGTILDITELNESYRKIQQMAFYDSLTSLPNRALFHDRLCQTIGESARHKKQFGLMFLDLDRFKAVNDTLGHPIGDKLLCETAARLTRSVRNYDTVSRLGGDEFALLLPEIHSVDVLGKIATKILDSFKEPYLLENKEVFVGCSIGIAVYPTDGEEAIELLKQADSAMYFAKHSGRNTFRFYSKDLTDSAKERITLETDLRRAIRRGELELYYQPKVSLSDGAVVGSEALVRWNHPERGIVSPEKFIPIAEDSGLILEIGEWVLWEAFAVASAWNRPGQPLHQVAVNLSARQFQSGDLAATVRRVLEQTQCRPEWIELEITESLLLDGNCGVMTTLNQFRDTGFTIAIDDFGTGYSSLSYLARFPIDTLKIDRSFINQVTERGHLGEIVKAVVSIARGLNQKVVAEGIETTEQLGFLQEFGCHMAQGYLFSRPVQKKTFESLPRSFGLSLSKIPQYQG